MRKETPIFIYLKDPSLIRYVQEMLNLEGFFHLDVLTNSDEVIEQTKKNKSAVLLTEIDLMEDGLLRKKISNNYLAIAHPEKHLNLKTLISYDLKNLIQHPINRQKLIQKLS